VPYAAPSKSQEICDTIATLIELGVSDADVWVRGDRMNRKPLSGAADDRLGSIPAA
jgi:hypothetical protein